VYHTSKGIYDLDSYIKEKTVNEKYPINKYTVDFQKII
jgi:hypothetical protein